MPTHIDRVTFAGSHGAELAARLDLPAGPPRAFALFAHCFTCSKDVFAASRIAAGLAEAGFGVLRFDFTGLGSSEGEFSNTNFSSNVEDLRFAADWLREHHHAPQLLVGHSLGGAAVLTIAADLPEVTAVATIGAPADLEHVVGFFGDARQKIEDEGEAMVVLAGRTFTVRQQFFDDLGTHALIDRVASMRKALLVLHSPIDNTVGIENAAQIFAAAHHPKSFLALDGADHLLSRRADATYAAGMIATFADRFIVDESGAVAAPAAGRGVLVAETTQGVFLNHVVAGSHRFLADEPVAIGGFDAGPSPYDLLAASLGACTSMTLRMYANRKGLPLDRVIVQVEHSKEHGDDCAACVETGRPMIDRFDRRLRLEGDLTEAERAALVGIADKCPVHRTLSQTSTIKTSLQPE